MEASKQLTIIMSALNHSILCLESVLVFVGPYCSLTDLACLSLASRSSLQWVLDSVSNTGKLTYYISSDEQCIGERVHRIILATRRRRIILGGDITDIGCARLRELLSRL